jgi:hypothetical protein
MSVQDKQIAELIANGEHWKAKEKLQGRLSALTYDCDLFESYGQVLLKMHDSLEAGKYLFLSGARKPEYDDSISLFLDRYSQKDICYIYHSFPKAAQAAEFSEFPSVVIRELNERGFSQNDIRKRTELGKPSSSPGNSFVGGLIVTVLLALLGGFLVSAVRGLVWVFKWITG